MPQLACLRSAGLLGPPPPPPLVLCSLPNGGGFVLRAEEVGGSGVVLDAEGVRDRDRLGVVERGVGGKGLETADCKLSCVREARRSSSFSLFGVGIGGRGGCASASVAFGAVRAEPLAPECSIVRGGMSHSAWPGLKYSSGR